MPPAGQPTDGKAGRGHQKNGKRAWENRGWAAACVACVAALLFALSYTLASAPEDGQGAAGAASSSSASASLVADITGRSRLSFLDDAAFSRLAAAAGDHLEQDGYKKLPPLDVAERIDYSDDGSTAFYLVGTDGRVHMCRYVAGSATEFSFADPKGEVEGVDGWDGASSGSSGSGSGDGKSDKDGSEASSGSANESAGASKAKKEKNAKDKDSGTSGSKKKSKGQGKNVKSGAGGKSGARKRGSASGGSSRARERESRRTRSWKRVEDVGAMERILGNRRDAGLFPDVVESYTRSKGRAVRASSCRADAASAEREGSTITFEMKAGGTLYEVEYTRGSGRFGFERKD